MEYTELNEWQCKRRQMLLAGGAALTGSLWPKVSLAELGEEFPHGFLWGAATAGHQVEGGNINSDSWLLENMQPTLFDEPSGDACDHYNRFDQDISMLSDLGLNTFRFSIEWSRVEPEAGQFSRAQIDHYRRVLESCQRYGVRSMVTFNHFTTPRWFAGLGGWENPESSWLFARYCDWVTRHLGEWMNYATTLNEPNLTQLLFCIPGYELTKLGTIKDQEIIRKAGTRVGTGRFSSWIFGDLEQVHQGLLQAHQAGYEAIKAVRPELPVGVSIAMEDDQPVGPGAMAMLERKRRLSYLPWFEMVQKHGDFLGVQAYSRARIGARGRLPPQAGYPLTDMGYEFYPEAVEGVIRYTHGHVKIPLYVTENGVATMDDTRRVDYIRRAVSGVARCLAAGIDVRGYIHWSLLDNFEWLDGYRPHFGLVAVDHRTFQRHIKPSATYLGEIARQNRVLVVPAPREIRFASQGLVVLDEGGGCRFFCWGMSTVLIDSLVPKLKVLFSLGYAEVLLTQFSFFIGYLVFSVPAGQILARLGYARSIALGLAAAVSGCLLFIPATEFREFPWFLGALFVLSAGITLLQVSVNPLVMELGDSGLAHSRLTLAQAFNSLGTTLGPLIGAAVILRHATFENMDPMRWPFLGIAVIFGALSLMFWKGQHSPDLPVLRESPRGVDWQLFKKPRFAFGWSALFVYVGAEVTLGSLMTSYLIQPQVLGVSAPVAGSLVSLYWGGAMMGRFMGSWVLSRLPAHQVLGGCALGAATLVLISSLSHGHLAAGALISVGLCNSIMFPVIFSLTLEDLGGDTPQGSGLLCMAIVGGALIPLLTGALADTWGLARAFGVPVLCYFLIASFAFLQKRMVRCEHHP